MMKIWIETPALNGKSDSLLRSGALYALKRLCELGYKLAWDIGGLSNTQNLLLANEQITTSDFGYENADAFISLQTAGQDGSAEQDPVPGQRTPEKQDPPDGQNTSTSKTTGNSANSSGTPLVIASGDGNVLAGGAGWAELVNHFLFPARTAGSSRKTKETDITVNVNIDGTGKASISTGLNFFDHMLEQIAHHGLMDLDIRCDGDLEIDEHHTIEDVAITLGKALREAGAKDKTGIQRYGFLLAMDEAQSQVAIDLSNRPYLVWNADFTREYVGDFPLEMAEHFFHTLAMNLKATLQIRIEGKNDHHKLESAFKGFAKAFRYAVTRTERMQNILPSSKGAL